MAHVKDLFFDRPRDFGMKTFPMIARPIFRAPYQQNTMDDLEKNEIHDFLPSQTRQMGLSTPVFPISVLIVCTIIFLFVGFFGSILSEFVYTYVTMNQINSLTRILYNFTYVFSFTYQIRFLSIL